MDKVGDIHIGPPVQAFIVLIVAPVHRYWEEILNDYIIPGKFDPSFMVTHRVPFEDMYVFSSNPSVIRNELDR